MKTTEMRVFEVTIAALFFLLASGAIGSNAALVGGCDCMQKAPKEQQLCLNALVVMTQRGTTSSATAAVTAVTPICSPSNQTCINAAVVAQLTAFKMSCSSSSQGTEYQSCLNNAICTQYRFAKESFKYVGKATVDPSFQPDSLPMVQVNKTSQKPIDPRQSVILPSYAYALRVVPGTGDMYQSWALNPITKMPSAPGLNASIKVDNSLESKYKQGDVATGGSKSVGGRKLSYVIGTDDRVQINPTTSYPWSAAVLIEFNIGSAGKGCSGTLVYGDAVLTAGHCVHKGSGGIWASSVRISPGANGAARPYGTASVAYMTTYVGWASGGNFKYDMAIIKLSSSIGGSTGWLGMMSSDSFSTNLNAIGYPGDKPWPTQWYYYCPGVSDSSAADSVTRNLCDIYPGQSGSGNYLKTSAGSRYVRGITSYQTCTCSTSACTGSGCGAPYYNYLQQLTSTRFSDAKRWAGIP